MKKSLFQNSTKKTELLLGSYIFIKTNTILFIVFNLPNIKR